MKKYEKTNTEAISEILGETLKYVDNQIDNNTEIDIIWNRFQDDLELAIREHVPLKTAAKPLV